MASAKVQSPAHSSLKFAKQAQQLSLLHSRNDDNQEEVSRNTAVEAKFITENDPVIETASGDRLPAVPLTEAQKLNELKDELEGRDSTSDDTAAGGLSQHVQKAKAAAQRATFLDDEAKGLSSPSEKEGVPLQHAVPPSRTNPLFPPLPLYGPPSLLRNIQCHIFRVTSFFLSLGFLAVIVLGSAFTSIPLMFKHIGMRLRFKDPSSRRPFYELEKKKRKERREAEKQWTRRKKRRISRSSREDQDKEDVPGWSEEFVPLEGGKDRLICDVGYYARRVGLDVEMFKVQTEDGFIIDLWHIYNPKEYTPGSPDERSFHSPEVFQDQEDGDARKSRSRAKRGRKYPVLMIHGLLQSAGAYCTNDDDSLAFFLAKR